MNLIILFEEDRIDSDKFCLKDYRAEHIINILKPSVGDQLEVGLLNKSKGTAVIEQITDNEVYLSEFSITPNEEPNYIVDIICALPRPQTLKKVLFTSAMMGVRNLYLIRANRVEKSYFHSPMLEKDNYEKHLIEGLMQGKNYMMPSVSFHEKFLPFIQDSLRLLYPNQPPQPIKLLPDRDAIIDMSKIRFGETNETALPLVVAIGPEGGWVDFEIDTMTELGFQKVSLGSWTLRVEHAVTAVLAQLELTISKN